MRCGNFRGNELGFDSKIWREWEHKWIAIRREWECDCCTAQEWEREWELKTHSCWPQGPTSGRYSDRPSLPTAPLFPLIVHPSVVFTSGLFPSHQWFYFAVSLCDDNKVPGGFCSERVAHFPRPPPPLSVAYFTPAPINSNPNLTLTLTLTLKWYK